MTYLITCSNCPYIEEVEEVHEVGDVCPDCGQVSLNVGRVEE